VVLTTRKFPVSLSGKGEFAIPNPGERLRSTFVGLESGAEFETAAVSYVGRDVSAEEVASKFLKHQDSPVPREALVALFSRYLESLQVFKIGNVLAIEYLQDAGFRLKLVARSPRRGPSRRLPG